MQSLETTLFLEKEERLSAISKQVGFTLWQLQELEGVLATYYVILNQATQEMGEKAGNALLKKAKEKTFGNTLREIKNAGLLTTDIEARFNSLLLERNWLVHGSRASSRNAIHHESIMKQLLLRLESIAVESLSLQR